MMLLMTFEPKSIIDYCREHPIRWLDDRKDLAKRGAPGDRLPPTPCADAFFKLLADRDGKLFSQKEYWEYCTDHLWKEWYYGMSEIERQGFSVKLYRNFYPSFIDSLHVWALLGTRYKVDGTLVFDRCVIDTKQDVITKTDLLLHRGDECIRIALSVNTSTANAVNAYKYTHRGAHVLGTVSMVMKPHPDKRGIGNKCWWRWPEDFGILQRKVEQLWFPGFQGDTNAPWSSVQTQ